MTLEMKGATTMSTQGMFEADHWRALLRDLDEHLCDIVSGNQGSFVPARGTVSMANLALTQLREAYPVADQLRDMGFEL